MIFDGKSVFDIVEEDLLALVQNHHQERQHLEFKATIDLKDDSAKLEALRDIASLANGGGGYLIVGIKDDGNGRAQRFAPEMVIDAEKIKKSLMSLTRDHISDPIPGLEIETMTVAGNPIVLIRVPESARIPHMITFQNRTDFYARHHDGKREMTAGEVREAFGRDFIGRRMTALESHVRNMVQAQTIEQKRGEAWKSVQAGDDSPLLFIEDGPSVSDLAFQRFSHQVGTQAFFWIAATPMKTRPNQLNVDLPEVHSKVTGAPPVNDRYWCNVIPSTYPAERFGSGIRMGSKSDQYLEILTNCHMEFWTPLNLNFCLPQSEQDFRVRPLLNGDTVFQYPLTFLQLYRALADVVELEGTVLVRMHYQNFRGYTLLPFSPNTRKPNNWLSRIRPFQGQSLAFPRLEIEKDFEPDKETYKLIKFVYNSFGIPNHMISHFNVETQQFEF